MKRKKPRPFRWWIVVLLVVAAAVVTGILLGLDKKETLKRAPSATGSSPGIEMSEGPLAQGGGAMDGEGQQRPTTDGQRLSPELKILSPEGQTSSSEGYRLSKEGQIISPVGERLSPEWKILSPDGTISSPEDYGLSKEGQIVPPEGQRLSPDWKIRSPDGTIGSSEGYRLSKEGQIISPEGQRLSPDWKILSPDGTISSREEQRLSSLEGSEAPLLAPPKREENDCLQVRQDLEDFFSYLDGRDYVKRLKPGIDTRAWFRDLIWTLSSSPPIPGGEGLDFQIMARNIFHFYRIMDKTDVRLVLEILGNEREALEMNLDLFFEWSFRKGHCPDPERFRPDETVLYRYAGFFLNTIGGRSYLSRRSSNLRVLITYYSVLIVHKRDQDGSNTYGIDPVPYIAPLAKEITMQKDLHFQNDYLQQLTRVSNYYTNRR